MNKSLLVTLDFPPMVGGVARYLKNLCGNLPNDQIVVMAPPMASGEESDGKRPYKIYRQPFYFKWFWPHWLPLLWRISRLVRQEQVEWIQVGQVLPIGTAVYLLTRLTKIKYLIYTHGLDITAPQKFYLKKFLLKLVLSRADKVVSNSLFTKAELLKLGVSEQKIVVVNPGVKVFDLYPDTQALEAELIKKYDLVGKRVLLTVSRLVERKGHDTVLMALPAVLAKFPNVLYAIVGEGPQRPQLEELVEKLKLQGSVRFFGEVTDKQKICWYDLCEIFVMTPKSLSNLDVEGFGIVYLEANGLAKPVVASASGGVRDAVIDGLNGLVVPPDDPDKTAEALIKLLTDFKWARALGEQGRQRAINEFSWERQAAKLKASLI